MSKKDMLGPTTRALVGVPQERLALVADIANRLTSGDGDIWYRHLSRVMREGLPRMEISAPLDTIVRVDRSIRPAYPEWVKDVLHPELELSGPAEYDLAKVESWLHDDQKNGKLVRGEKLYKHLKSDNTLDSCLSLADALAIQAKGIAVFREYFNGKVPFFWKSVVRNDDGHLRVPFLCESGGEFRLGWNWLDSAWHDVNYPALRFASQN